jgi:uncharacterized membrane protein YhaH (DUF805 family)
MVMPLKRYADFSGRSRRKEYWMFVLFQILVLMPMALVFAMIDGANGEGEPGVLGGLMLAVMGLVYLGLFFIPGLAVQVRRFHDRDKSGWLILLGFIPYLGGFILLVFMCLEGTRGPNRFGPDPKDPYGEDVFA